MGRAGYGRAMGGAGPARSGGDAGRAARAPAADRPAPEPPTVLARILLAFDGTDPSRRAATLAFEIAGRFHSQVTIAVVQPEGSSAGELASLVPVTEDGRSLGSLVEEISKNGRAIGAAAVQTVYLQGDVEENLLEYLGSHPQDLAVVGSRGLTRGRRFLLGSVSSTLVSSAPCPVLVVRAPHPRRSGAAPKSPVP
jgi:nucleotide-binding universal stress UspA family protein